MQYLEVPLWTKKKKKGFHMVLKWVKMLEVVRDEARGVGQSQTKKTIRRHK